MKSCKPWFSAIAVNIVIFANCRDFLVFVILHKCLHKNLILMNTNCDLFCNFNTKNYLIQINCCTFHMLCYVLTQQSACMCFFRDHNVTIVSFTLQPFSYCSYCCLFFCPKCRRYKKAVPDDDYKGFGSMSWLDWCQWCTSVIKYGGQGQSTQAIKLFQVPRKISTLRI